MEETTKADWAEKDRVKQISIESQTAFNGVIELLVAKIITPDDALGKAAMAWAAERLGTKAEEKPILVKQPLPIEPAKGGSDAQTGPPIPNSQKLPEAAEEEESKSALTDIKDITDLYTRYRALDKKLSDLVIFGLAGVKSWSALSKAPAEQLTELWIEVLARWGAEKKKEIKK